MICFKHVSRYSKFFFLNTIFVRIHRRGPSNFFRSPGAQARFGASVFWMRRLAALGDEEKAIEDWQVKRDGGQRGIVEIIKE